MQYQELIKTIEERKAVEKLLGDKEAEYEKTVAIEKALLYDLLEKENRQRTELLLEMKEKNVETEKVDGHLITRNIRKTNQIKDAKTLAKEITKFKLVIVEDLGITEKQLSDLFKEETVITDKKLATDIVNNLEKIDDILLEGVEKKTTEFLTVT